MTNAIPELPELPVFMNQDDLTICGVATVSPDAKKIVLEIDMDMMFQALPELIKQALITSFFVSVNRLPAKKESDGQQNQRHPRG